jgi:hypothetical protein
MTSLEFIAVRGQLIREKTKDQISILFFMVFCGIVGLGSYYIYKITNPVIEYYGIILILTTIIGFMAALSAGIVGFSINSRNRKQLDKLENIQNKDVKTVITELGLRRS